MPSNPARIVGVVGHVRHWGLASDDQSRVRDQIYVSLYQLPDPLVPFLSSVMPITVRTSLTPLSVAEPLRREMRGPGRDHTHHAGPSAVALPRAFSFRQRFFLGVFASVARLVFVL